MRKTKPRNPGGRPRTRTEPSVLITTRVDQSVAEALDEWAAANGIKKRSPAVAECVRRELKRSGGK